jgi:hypothetical protein
MELSHRPWVHLVSRLKIPLLYHVATGEIAQLSLALAGRELACNGDGVGILCGEPNSNVSAHLKKFYCTGEHPESKREEFYVLDGDTATWRTDQACRS